MKLSLAAALLLFSLPSISQKADTLLTKKIRARWDEVSVFQKNLREGKVTSEADPQPKFAEEFFQYYIKNKTVANRDEAATAAIVMWANSRKIDQLEKAIASVPNDSEVFANVLDAVRDGYFAKKEKEKYRELLYALRKRITNPAGKAELYFKIGEYYKQEFKRDSAIVNFKKVMEQNARPYTSEQARSAITEIRFLNIGQLAPDFAATTVDRKVFSLSQFNGKVVVLQFSATWCEPCEQDFQYLKQLYQNISHDELQIITISKDETEEIVKQYVIKKQLPWLNVFEEFKWQGQQTKVNPIAGTFNAYLLPRNYVIDRQGIIVAKDVQGDALIEAVNKLVY